MREFLLALKAQVEVFVNTLDTIVAQVGDGADDITPPAAPTSLAGTSASGGVTLTWNNPGDADLLLIEVWENSVNTQPDPNTQASLRVGTVIALPGGAGSYDRAGVTAGHHLYYWVRAVDTAGNSSDFNATSGVDVYVTAGTGDGIAPSAPTSVAAIAGFQDIWLTWVNPSDTDLAKVIIYENTTNNSATATIVGTVNATPSSAGSYDRSGLTNNLLRYYWLKAVDADGNLSVFSSGVSATTGTIDPADLGTVVGFAAPTGLGVTSALSTDTDGTQVVYLNSSWSSISDARLSFYEMGVVEAATTEIVYTTSDVAYRLRVKANISYTVRVRGVDRNGNRTSWSTGVTVTSTRKTAAPSAPGTPTALVGIGSVYLQWTNPSDAELAVTQVYVATDAAFATETLAGTVSAAPSQTGKFAHTGLGTNVQRWYRLKSRDTSGNLSAYSGSVTATTAQATSADIIVNNVLANSIVSNVTTTNVLSAAVLQSSTTIPASLVIGVTGFTLAAVADPATPINANSTLITPGKVLISGSTTLSNWRNGTDNTKIEGGSIATNTVTANKVSVGLRGLDVTGLSFEPNSASFGSGVTTANSIAWIGGTINYIDDTGTLASQSISAGTIAWTTGVQYIYWTKGASTLSATTTASTAISAGTVCMAMYYGASNMFVSYGRTIIDGNSIKTGSVDADRINAGTITTNLMAANTINGDRITANTLNASKIVSASITATQIAATTITAANIVSGTITATQIAATTITASNIAVGTITANEIVGGAITSTSWDEQTYGGTLTNSNVQVFSLSHTTSVASAPHVINLNATCANGAGNAGVVLNIKRDGTLIAIRSFFANASFQVTGAFSVYDNGATAASHTYTIEAATTSGSGTNCVLAFSNMIITELKR